MTRYITVRSGTVPRKVIPPASMASAAGADTDAIHDNVDGEIVLITEKVSPVGADVLLIEDSDASNAKKRVQITNLPGGADADAIHDNVASEISAITAKATPDNGDFLIIEDSAAANIKKSITIGNLPGSDHDTPIATHAGLPNVHHTKYTDTEAAAKIAADDLYVKTAGDAMTGALAMGANKITGVADPTQVQDAATKTSSEAYADSLDHDHATPIATHAALSNDHHNEAHAVVSHSDTTATGTELETLTDGSNADALHAHAHTEPALGDVTDVTITAVGINEILAKSAGDWINKTLAEAGIEATGHTHLEADVTDLDHDGPIATHTAITTAHHTKYLNSEAVTAMGAKGDANALHHDRYTDAEADTRAALQDHDHSTPIATHAGLPDAHHTESHNVDSHSDVTITAVAQDEVLVKSAGDWINQTLAEAGIEAAGTAASQDHDHDTPIGVHAALPNAHHAESHNVASHSDTTATGAELETLTDGSETTLHSHAGGSASTALSELLLIGA